jgi:hypothetical protein
MKFRYAVMIFLGLISSLSACSGKPTAATDESGKTIGRSANWKVEIVSAKKELSHEAGRNSSRLALDLRFDYLGPKGPVRAPTFTLSTDYSKTVIPVTMGWKPEDKTFAPWLLSGLTDSIYGAKDPPDPQSLTTLETGQTLQVHVYYLDVPSASQHPKLIFADVPPIPFEVEKS